MEYRLSYWYDRLNVVSAYVQSSLIAMVGCAVAIIREHPTVSEVLIQNRDKTVRTVTRHEAMQPEYFI